MSLFGFLKKNDGSAAKDTPLKKRVRDMKCRKVSFVDTDFDELKRDMRQSSDAVLKLKPVNYYAVKNNYILALIYSSADFEENYVQFKRIEYEKQTGESDIFPLDKATVVKALAKVGIIVNPDPPQTPSED